MDRLLLPNHVESESESHCFVDDEPMALRTSSTVTDSRSDHVDIVLFEYDELSADSVAARMSAVFLSMTSWYCSAVKHFSALGFLSLRNVFTCRQIRRELSATDLISVFLFDDAFFLASSRLKRSDVLQAALDSAFLLVLDLRSNRCALRFAV